MERNRVLPLGGPIDHEKSSILSAACRADGAVSATETAIVTRGDGKGVGGQIHIPSDKILPFEPTHRQRLA